MHIVVLGAGAMGCLMAARLGGTDARVSLLGRNPEHARIIDRQGVTVEELGGATAVYRVACHDSPLSLPGDADLVVVLVKSYDTADAVSGVGARCGPSTMFLTLQNGAGNWETIADAVGGRERVLAGTTAQGATLLAPGRIRHGGNGATYIGEVDGPPTGRVLSVVDLFRRAGIEAHAGAEMQKLIWEKLLVNVGINAITALTGIRNGMIAGLDAARELSADAVREAVAVAASVGVVVGDEMVERVFSVAEATAVNRSSMGQDVDRKKRTEIDAINGVIVRQARRAGIDAPVNRTLVRLVKTLEAGYASG